MQSAYLGYLSVIILTVTVAYCYDCTTNRRPSTVTGYRITPLWSIGDEPICCHLLGPLLTMVLGTDPDEHLGLGGDVTPAWRLADLPLRSVNSACELTAV